METIGIIGFGNFGRFMTQHLAPHFDVTVYDKRDITKEAKKLGVKSAPLKETASKGIVILSVPVQRLEGVLKQIKPHLAEGTLVMDVSSVKVIPVQLMQKHLPPGTEFISTHPLFGPQSGKSGIKGMTIVVCPVRTRRFAQVSAFLRDKLGLKVEEKTPRQHDAEMAETQTLAHFIAKALQEMGVKENGSPLATHRSLVALRNTVKGDSPELFDTIQSYNPFAAKARAKLLTALQEIDAGLGPTRTRQRKIKQRRRR